MADKFSVHPPTFEYDDKEIKLNMQKILLLTLYENKKMDFNQYQHAVELLENKFGRR